MVDYLVQEVGRAMCVRVVNRYVLITVAERSDYWHKYTTNSHTSYQACIPQLMYIHEASTGKDHTETDTLKADVFGQLAMHIKSVLLAIKHVHCT